MEPIRRAGSPQRLPSTQLRTTERFVEEVENAPERMQGQARAPRERSTTGFRPAAGFLTQYVDQHFPWARSPFRKEGKRQRAASAYLAADMLPDVLADALRIRTIDKDL